jgi:hypothetical protein
MTSEKIKWEENEIDFIVKNYKELGSKKCAEKLGRTLSACEHMANKLKVTTKQGIWKDEEIDFLKDNYSELGPKECAEKIERTLRACELMAKKLGVKYRKNKRYYDKEKLENIIIESKTYTEVLLKLSLTNKAGNFDTLKKYIKLYNIDTSHFYSKEEHMKKLSSNKKLNEKDVLIKNSTYSRDSLKKRLYNDGLKERKCELCGQDENWMGKKMSLILDHINGINDDNRLENLRIVCPNCNATLDTHCRGNKKENNKEHVKELNIELYKCECGNNKTKESKQCTKCYAISQRKAKWPEYSVLIKEIEEMGYTGTGRKYGVSDNTIRKWKKQYEKLC